MESFYKELTVKMKQHKLTTFTLSCELKYNYVALYKAYVNNSPDVKLIILLNRFFKCADFSKFAGN